MLQRYNKSLNKILFLVYIFACSCNSTKQLNYDNSKYEDLIILPGFGTEEFDTIKIKLYKKDQSFKNCFDSLYLFVDDENYQYPQEIYVIPKFPISIDCDWEIILNDTSVYRVENIKMGATPEYTMLSEAYGCNLISCNLNDSIMDRKNITISVKHPRRSLIHNYK